MEAPVRVQHKGREAHVELLRRIVVVLCLLSLATVTHSFHSPGGSQLLPHLGCRVADGHITQEGCIRQVELNVWTAISVFCQAARLDVCIFPTTSSGRAQRSTFSHRFGSR